MSDVNLLGVLRMPIECWNNSVIDQMQRRARYIEAADRIEASTKEIDALRAENAELKLQVQQARSK